MVFLNKSFPTDKRRHLTRPGWNWKTGDWNYREIRSLDWTQGCGTYQISLGGGSLSDRRQSHHGPEHTANVFPEKHPHCMLTF